METASDVAQKQTIMKELELFHMETMDEKVRLFEKIKFYEEQN